MLDSTVATRRLEQGKLEPNITSLLAQVLTFLFPNGESEHRVQSEEAQMRVVMKASSAGALGAVLLAPERPQILEVEASTLLLEVRDPQREARARNRVIDRPLPIGAAAVVVPRHPVRELLLEVSPKLVSGCLGLSREAYHAKEPLRHRDELGFP